MAGLRLMIQKASSALISNMIGLTLIFLLLLVPELALCFPVTAGGNGPVQMFYCKLKGCAADVTKVFCNDKTLLDHSDIPNCSGPPQPNNVCQHDGRAFVSTSANGDCQFEGEKHIATEKCTDFNNTFLFNDPTSPTPVNLTGSQVGLAVDQTQNTVIGVLVAGVVVLVLVLGVIAYVRKKRRSRQPNPEQQSDPGETEALNMDQRSGDLTERAPPADPGLDDDTSPSQCDSGA